MLTDDPAFIRSMRRIADNHEGPEHIRIPRNVLERLTALAERGLGPITQAKLRQENREEFGS